MASYREWTLRQRFWASLVDVEGPELEVGDEVRVVEYAALERSEDLRNAALTELRLLQEELTRG